MLPQPSARQKSKTPASIGGLITLSVTSDGSDRLRLIEEARSILRDGPTTIGRLPDRFFGQNMGSSMGRIDIAENSEIISMNGGRCSIRLGLIRATAKHDQACEPQR